MRGGVKGWEERRHLPLPLHSPSRWHLPPRGDCVRPGVMVLKGKPAPKKCVECDCTSSLLAKYLRAMKKTASGGPPLSLG